MSAQEMLFTGLEVRTRKVFFPRSQKRHEVAGHEGRF